jgi:hypothetical protein
MRFLIVSFEIGLRERVLGSDPLANLRVAGLLEPAIGIGHARAVIVVDLRVARGGRIRQRGLCVAMTHRVGAASGEQQQRSKREGLHHENLRR